MEVPPASLAPSAEPSIFVGFNELELRDKDAEFEAVEAAARQKAKEEAVRLFLQKEGRFFQGGNAPLLHTLLQLGPGEGSRVLYVGDHVYADIVRSKRTLGWRTCLIVPELTRELKIHKQQRHQRLQLLAVRKRQYLLERDLDALFTARQRAALNKGLLLMSSSSSVSEERGPLETVEELDARIEALSEKLKTLRLEVRRQLDKYNEAFHPRWGQVPKFESINSQTYY